MPVTYHKVQHENIHLTLLNTLHGLLNYKLDVTYVVSSGDLDSAMLHFVLWVARKIL
mgnify:CR=1 FL=1